jgi:hypothetical protein
MFHTALISSEKFIVAKYYEILCFVEFVRLLINSELIVRLVSGRGKIYISRKLKNMLCGSEVMCNSCCHLNGRNACVSQGVCLQLLILNVQFFWDFYMGMLKYTEYLRKTNFSQ